MFSIFFSHFVPLISERGLTRLLPTVAQSSTNSTDSGVECSNGSAVECSGQDLESCGTRSVGGLVKESAERSIIELSNTCDSDTNVKVRRRWKLILSIFFHVLMMS